jgi:hypothetical protein
LFCIDLPSLNVSHDSLNPALECYAAPRTKNSILGGPGFFRESPSDVFANRAYVTGHVICTFADTTVIIKESSNGDSRSQIAAPGLDRAFFQLQDGFHVSDVDELKSP